MIYGVLAWICAIGGLAAFSYRLPDLLRRKHDIALWALCTYFLCSGISFLVDLDQLRLHISDFFGLPNITSLITQVAVVVLTAAQQVVLVYWSSPPAEARRMAQITGWTIPSWGIHITRALGWIRSYRSYLRLRPLWWALYQASPDIALDPPRSRPRDLIPPRDPHYSLYRRVIEIRDGQMMLRTSLSLADFSRVARSLELPEDPTSPLGEALQVRAVLSRPAEERAEQADASDASDVPARPPYEDFRDEVEWLTKVASSFTALGRGRPGHTDARLLS